MPRPSASMRYLLGAVGAQATGRGPERGTAASRRVPVAISLT